MKEFSDRRSFIRRAFWGGAGLGTSLAGASVAWSAPKTDGFTSERDQTRQTCMPVTFSLSEGADLPLPPDKRVPYGWRTLTIPNDRRGLVLRWNNSGPFQADRFRFTLALDEREEKKIEVVLAASGRVLGTVDLRYGYACQPFELHLAPKETAAVLKEGIRMRVLDNASPSWIFGENRPTGEGQAFLLPHLLAKEPRSPWSAAFSRLSSLASLQPFGWLEGCVLEGLSELEKNNSVWRRQAGEAIDQHLNLYFPGDDMILETPRSVPSDNRWYSPQATIMVPTLFRRRPSHAIVDHAYAFMTSREPPRDDLSNSADTEGCYTLAYPMALIAMSRKDDAHVRLALRQLIARKHHLLKEGRLYQRHVPGSGGHADGNWSRGVAWYLLGHARLLEAVGIDYNDASRQVAEELRRAIEWIVSFQQADGLWPCYAHEIETGPETSGSAGISAAMLLAHRLGLAHSSVTERARSCLKGLQDYLTPDGFLLGVAQANKGGDALQRGGYRVNSQMALGLAVQLAALLGSTDT